MIPRTILAEESR